MLLHWEYIIARDHKGWDGNGGIPAGWDVVKWEVKCVDNTCSLEALMRWLVSILANPKREQRLLEYL